MATYAASKAFVLSFTEALWVETEEAGVRVMDGRPQCGILPSATNLRLLL
jgi:short-subunit dehydrogenase